MKLHPALLGLALAVLAPALRAQTYTFSTVPGALYNSGGIAVDPTGAIYTSSLYSGYIVKTSPTGAELARYGVAYSSGSSDGAGTVARFHTPQGLALDSGGNLYVADTGNHTVRKISPAGVVTTLAGLAQNAGRNDGTDAAARFNAPRAIVVDAAGTIYVADSGNHTIRRISPAGEVTTVAGTAGVGGSVDAIGAAARFSTPAGLAVDSAGNLFVADYANHTVRKITPAGAVSTVAGLAGSHGRVDAAGSLARFFYPQGIAVDAAGNLFVADAGNYAIRRITAAGLVTTVGGLAGFSGESAGVGAAARFYGPRALTVTGGGDLYLADAGSTRLGVSSGQLAITVQPQAMSVGIGSTARLTVTATGAAPLSYQWQKDGTPLAGATNATLTLASVSSLHVGTYTVTATNPLGSLASTGAALAIVAAVPNDDFADAVVLTGTTGSATGSNNGATGEPEEPTHHVPGAATSSIWYKWTAPETGTAVFSISANFPTAQVAWTGTALNDLTRAASTSGSRLNFRAVAGTTYHLALGSNGTARGNLTLAWHMVLHDTVASARAVAGDSGSVTTASNGALSDPLAPATPRPPANSVWLRWSPARSGTALWTLPLGTESAVYTGTGPGALAGVSPFLTPLQPPGFPTYNRAFNVDAGSTYWIALASGGSTAGDITASWQVSSAPIIVSVSGSRQASPGTGVTFSATYLSNFTPALRWFRNGTAIADTSGASLTLPAVSPADAGTYVLRIDNGVASTETTVGHLTVLTPPANDNFAAATAMNGLAGRLTGTNVDATGEPSEPAHWNLAGTASAVWYRWTPAASGLAAIDTVGSAFDTVLAVYTGPASATVASLNRLTQDDDRGGGRTSLVSFAAVANTTYYLAVGGATGSARGNVVLNWQLTPVLAVATPPASQTVVAGGSATFSVTATGAGLTYQWNRNGTPIPGATQSTLTVSNLAPGADAAFTVTLTNSSGSVTSAPATLTVAAPATTTFAVRHPGKADVGMLWSIAANGDTLVACGDGGAILSSSDNGRTWTPRLSGNTAWLVAVTYGGGQFVIVGEGGRILTSADGITWTAVAATGTTERLNNVLFADGKYVAIGEHGACVTSPDGRVWTPRSTPVNTWLHGLAWHAGLKQFAAAGENAVFLVSADAITWTRLPVAGYTGHLHHIAAVDSYAHFVTVGDQGKAVSVRQNQVVLKDGQPLTTWSAEVLATNTTKTLIGLVQAAGALYAMSEDGQVITATSDRGPWIAIDTPTRSADGRQHFLNAGIFQNDTLFIVGQFQTVLQSEALFTSRLRNISTRGEVGTGGNIMISGFIVRGDRPKSVLVRAAGPALGAFGVPGTLAAPVLSVLDRRAAVVASNAGWSTAANASAIAATAARVSAFPFGAGSADAALLATLSPGEYTAQVSGADGTTGICLVEVYDTDAIANTGSQAVNISTRGLSGAGSSKMIAGFIIEGAAARRVLIRAVGPGLAPFGVAGTLAEPTLEIYNSRGLLHATAGAWGLQPNADEIRGAFASGGAFALAEGSKDSAIVLALPPGSWTVQVGGATAANGVAIIEVYTLP